MSFFTSYAFDSRWARIGFAVVVFIDLLFKEQKNWVLDRYDVKLVFLVSFELYLIFHSLKVLVRFHRPDLDWALSVFNLLIDFQFNKEKKSIKKDEKTKREKNVFESVNSPNDELDTKSNNFFQLWFDFCFFGRFGWSSPRLKRPLVKIDTRELSSLFCAHPSIWRLRLNETKIALKIIF